MNFLYLSVMICYLSILRLSVPSAFQIIKSCAFNRLMTNYGFHFKICLLWTIVGTYLQKWMHKRLRIVIIKSYGLLNYFVQSIIMKFNAFGEVRKISFKKISSELSWIIFWKQLIHQTHIKLFSYKKYKYSFPI